MPHAVLCGEFLLHAPCCFDVGIFSYRPHAVLCGEFLLHTTRSFIWGVSLSCPVLFYVGSFSYTPMLFPVGTFSYTPYALFYVGSVSYTACAILCVEFVLHILRCLCGECVLHTLC